MPNQDAVSNESFELQTETARLMIRAAAIVLSATAVFGVLTLPVMPMPAGPVALSNSGPTARVSVIDNGAGIAPDVVETIWEPYARAHPVSPTTTDSIGLGLAVSLRLATLMDGDLAYRFEDGNSVFELTLPAAETAASAR